MRQRDSGFSAKLPVPHGTSTGRWCVAVYRPRVLVLASLLFAAPTNAQDAATLIKKAIDYWRDTSSYVVMEMNIHRPDWQRSMAIRVWTRGRKQPLARKMRAPSVNRS